MSASEPAGGAAAPPRAILLATDLSARCDRAQDRALALAARFAATLTLLHVAEDEPAPPAGSNHLQPSWRASGEPAVRAGRIDPAVRVESGDPAEVIARVAREIGAGLIVTGIAHERPLAQRPVTLGRTVERLLRESRLPVLVVRERPRGDYGHVLVASDLSEVSARALRTALEWFPDQRVRLLHAFDAPYSGLVADVAEWERGYRAERMREVEAFLEGSGADRARLEVLVERGRPETLVGLYVRERGADLVVLGAHSRGAIAELFVGSTAKSVLSTLECDALVLPG